VFALEAILTPSLSGLNEHPVAQFIDLHDIYNLQNKKMQPSDQEEG
jgi:hypothetical protein